MARPRNRTAGIGLTEGWRSSYVRWAPRAAFAMGVLWLLPPAAIVGLGAVAGSERLRIAGITILPLPAAPGEGGVFSGMLLLFVGEFAFVRLEANAGTALVIGVGTVLIASGCLMLQGRRAGWCLLAAVLGAMVGITTAGLAAALAAALASPAPATAAVAAVAALGLALIGAVAALHVLVRPLYR